LLHHKGVDVALSCGRGVSASLSHAHALTLRPTVAQDIFAYKCVVDDDICALKSRLSAESKEVGRTRASTNQQGSPWPPCLLALLCVRNAAAKGKGARACCAYSAAE
jgi:hypothetical protein